MILLCLGFYPHNTDKESKQFLWLQIVVNIYLFLYISKLLPVAYWVINIKSLYKYNNAFLENICNVYANTFSTTLVPLSKKNIEYCFWNNLVKLKLKCLLLYFGIDMPSYQSNLTLTDICKEVL